MQKTLKKIFANLQGCDRAHSVNTTSPLVYIFFYSSAFYIQTRDKMLSQTIDATGRCSQNVPCCFQHLLYNIEVYTLPATFCSISALNLADL
jgi:hypothetical protein